jgi:hypothetical protein
VLPGQPGRGYFPAAREVNFGQPGRFFLTFSGHDFFGTFFSFKRIITNLEAEQPGRQSEGNFNLGFSTKTYPNPSLKNVILKTNTETSKPNRAKHKSRFTQGP